LHRWLFLGVTLATFGLAACGSGGNTAPRPAATAAPGVDSGLSSPARASTSTIAPVYSTAKAPWPPPSNAAPLIAAAGLPALPNEELTYHVHAHLDVFVDGVPQPVAGGIGIDFGRGQISPLHTHDTSGIIHIESASAQAFNLGQLLTEWGLRHDGGCIAAYCRPDVPILTYVNGSERTGDRDLIELNRYDEVAIVIGKPPSQVPDHYDFEPGY
jgi:hypothetical protein